MEKEAKPEPPGQRALKSMSRSTMAWLWDTGKVCACLIPGKKTERKRKKKERKKKKEKERRQGAQYAKCTKLYFLEELDYKQITYKMLH